MKHLPEGASRKKNEDEKKRQEKKKTIHMVKIEKRYSFLSAHKSYKHTPPRNYPMKRQE